MFINLVENVNLDGMGFSPFGIMVGGGMKVLNQLYSGYRGGGRPFREWSRSGKDSGLGEQVPQETVCLKLSYVRSVLIANKPMGSEEL